MHKCSTKTAISGPSTNYAMKFLVILENLPPPSVTPLCSKPNALPF